MNYSCTKEFEKDFKKLSKKFKTLKDDIELFKDILKKFPFGNGRHSNILTKTDDLLIIKARLFSKSLKKSSLRIIYSCNKDCSRFELISIEFIEVYFKGDKENEDRGRIDGYLKKR
ncbi:MAG: hypothetical protein PF572_06810 [Patescibacteria group bacterium]|jgi:mRNA-degrading endonuclease RelE of RelBE toxin-antitoxin system|nr:hypothetical protein [Patescibacteria group bacterium]